MQQKCSFLATKGMEMHLRSSVENPQDKNKSMKGPGVTIPWYMGKELCILLHRYLLNCVHCCSTHSSSVKEATQLSFNWWMTYEWWYAYTLEYYSAVNENEVMNFSGKQMKLEKIISSELTNPERQMLQDLFHLKFLDHNLQLWEHNQSNCWNQESEMGSWLGLEDGRVALERRIVGWSDLK